MAFNQIINRSVLGAALGEFKSKLATIFAPLASPALTGTPTAPTAAAGTDSTQIATTAFVQSAVGGVAPLNSPALTGIPTAPTASTGTDTTQIATTAFVQSEIENKAVEIAEQSLTDAQKAQARANIGAAAAADIPSVPTIEFTTQSLSVEYTLAANAATEITLTAANTLNDSVWTVLGLNGFTSGNSNVYIQRISSVTANSCLMVVCNNSATAQSRTASVYLRLMKITMS